MQVTVTTALTSLPGFASSLVEWLKPHSAMKVSLAFAGELARPGHVYIGQDHAHLGISASGHLIVDRATGGNFD